MSVIDVVALVMVDKSQKKILLAQRPVEKGSEWEFPGGKREAEELLTEALKREIKEELCMQINIDQELGVEVVPSGKVTFRIHFFLSLYEGQKITLTEHQKYQWVSKDELNNFKISKENLNFLNKSDLLSCLIS